MPHISLSLSLSRSLSFFISLSLSLSVLRDFVLRINNNHIFNFTLICV